MIVPLQAKLFSDAIGFLFGDEVEMSAGVLLFVKLDCGAFGLEKLCEFCCPMRLSHPSVAKARYFPGSDAGRKSDDGSSAGQRYFWFKGPFGSSREISSNCTE